MSSVYSMTGFASVRGAEASSRGFTLTVKSVNHRFLDLLVRVPQGCELLEAQLRKIVKESVRRGHVELTLQMDRSGGGEARLNEGMFAAYVAAFRRAREIFDEGGEMNLNAVLRMPGVISADGGGGRDLVAGMEDEVVAAMGPLLQRLNEVRGQEGAALVEEMRAGMSRLRGLAEEVMQLRVGVRDGHVERLRARLAEVMEGSGVGEERLLAEAALLADRSDVEEEMVRMVTHVDRFLLLLEEGGELGKRLDFLSQELNREGNTLLSKTGGAVGASGLRITELGLEMKTEIERAREQVQNLE